MEGPLVVLSVLLVHLTLTHCLDKRFCDERLFDPYVKVLKTKSGPVIKELRETGFMDLRKQVAKILCVNGPAFLFHGRVYRWDLFDATDDFKKGSMKVYQHECFSINIGPAEDLFAPWEWDGEDMVPESGLRSSTTGVRVKVFGIKLLGNLGDYRPPPGLVYQFSGPDFTLLTEFQKEFYLVSGDSFAVLASKDQRLFCYNYPVNLDNDTNVHHLVLITPKTKRPQICLRAGGEGALQDLFTSKFFEYSSLNWRPCLDGTDDDLDGEDDKEEEKGKELGDPRILDLFATVNTNRLRKTMRLQKSLSTNTKQHSGTKCTVHERNCKDEGDGIRHYTVPDKLHGSINHTWKINVRENCTPFPEINPVNCLDSDPISVISCVLLNNVLMLPSKPLEEFKIFDTDEDWRSRVLNLIDSIFVKICPMVPAQMSPSVSRVLATYLMSVKNNGHRLPERRDKLWNFLESQLRYCDSKSRSMASYFEVRYDDLVPLGEIQSVRNTGPLQDEDDSNLRSARFLSFQTSGLQEKPAVVGGNPKPVQELFTIQSNEDYLDLPSEIRIKTKASNLSSKPIFYYDEAAELEYAFNSGIDSHWKIFSTVIGYCNSFYKARKSETFPRLYSTYFEDFIYPLDKIWKSPEDNEDLSYIISEYTTDVVIKWLDSCLEASYLISNSSTFRPPRPIIISKGNSSEFNFFTKFSPPPPSPLRTANPPATKRIPYTITQQTTRKPVATHPPITHKPRRPSTSSITPVYKKNEICTITCNDAHVCNNVCRPLIGGEDSDIPEDECLYTCNTGPFCEKKCRSLKANSKG